MTRRFRIADTAIPGAHAQIWIEEGTCATGTLVRREEDAAGPVIVLPREWLVEVKPPSIDDPVELPLRLVDPYEDGLEIHSYKENEDAAAYVQRFGRNGLVGSPVDLTAEQCRDAARALWLLGTREQP